MKTGGGVGEMGEGFEETRKAERVYGFRDAIIGSQVEKEKVEGERKCGGGGVR